MQQKFIFLPQLRSWLRRGQFLCLVGLGMVSAIALWVLPLSMAALGQLGRDRPQIIAADISSNWQGASFPVENFQAYTSPFGYRPSPYDGTGQEFHRGLDIAAPQGSYIRSWWGGKVAELSDNTNCGTSVIVQSGDWQHIYCHMAGKVASDAQGKYLSDPQGGIQLRWGQEVAAGERIGRVGMTGRTTGPHLHWGLKYAGDYIDPALVLRAMYAQQGATERASMLR